MRTKFLCASKDEMFLQGIFREEQDLSFEEVVNRARRQEEVAKVAPETAATPVPAHKVLNDRTHHLLDLP